MNRKDSIPIPSPVSPVDGIKLLDAAVQFCWKGTEDGFGYELQYARSVDFSDARSVVLQNLHPADKYAHLPEPSLSSGGWFWRVRTMTKEGIFGRWSPSRSFTTVTTRKEKDRELTISAEHPLFIFFSGDEIVENWASLPEQLKPYVVFRVERHATEELIPLCELAQQHQIPLLIQLAGPHDVYSGKYARIPLSDVEYLFQHFPTVKGVQIVEQSCQGGLKQRRVTRYLIGMIRLAAAYGKLAVWADGHWHGNNIWIDAGLHEELYRTMCECGDYIVPMWKMNCGWTPYSVQGAVFGIWAAGAVANWGVEPESWYWYEAGFRELNQQYDFKNGNIDLCPSPFWGQMILMGLSAGAAVYCIEPPQAIWSAAGKIAETAQRVIFPLLSRIIEWRLIPNRKQMRKMSKIAYVASKADSQWREDGGTFRTLYEGTYGLDHPFKMIPATGRYGWIPVLSPHTTAEEMKRYSALIHAGSFRTAEDVRAYFDREYDPAGEGNVWYSRVGNLSMVTNPHENRDVTETFALPLDGSFLQLEGEIAVNGYLIVQQEAEGTLRMHLNGRSDRELPLRLLMRDAAAPQIEATPKDALQARRYDEQAKCTTLTVSFAKGAVDIGVYSD